MCIPFEVVAEEARGEAPAHVPNDRIAEFERDVAKLRLRAEQAEREAEIWKAQAEGQVPTAAKYMSEWVGEIQQLEADCAAKNQRIIECLEKIMELMRENELLRSRQARPGGEGGSA